MELISEKHLNAETRGETGMQECDLYFRKPLNKQVKENFENRFRDFCIYELKHLRKEINEQNIKETMIKNKAFIYAPSSWWSEKFNNIEYKREQEKYPWRHRKEPKVQFFNNIKLVF